MNHRRSGEVVERGAEQIHHERTLFTIGQPAASPGPMTGNGINQYADGDGVDHVHGELGAFGHGTRYDGGRSGAEDCLENQESLAGKSGVQERKVEEMGHPNKSAGSEHQSETDEPEEQRTQHEVYEVLHQDVAGVFGACKSGFDQCEAWLHEEYEHGCQKHPNGIDTCGQFGHRVGGCGFVRFACKGSCAAQQQAYGEYCA